MRDFFIKHFTELLAAAIGAVPWLLERRKRKLQERSQRASVEADEASADGKIIDLYQDALDDLKRRYDEKFNDLKKEIEDLKRNQELWKNKYRQLKTEFDNYRKKHES